MTIKKIKKLIDLISLLQQKPPFSRDEILLILGIEHATFYRYIKYLRNKGIKIRNRAKHVEIIGDIENLNEFKNIHTALNCLNGFL
jgi:predicted DNA-binding transcriptional regulator YafY